MALVALAAACNLEFRELKGGDRDSLMECTPRGKISYAQIVREVFEPNDCLLCHGANRPTDLSSYPKVRAQLESIREEVLVTRRMPKDRPPVTAEQANLLADWINDCAPEQTPGEPVPSPTPSPTASPSPSPSPSPSSDPSPTPSPSESSRPLVRWPQVLSTVFQPKCFDCHSTFVNIATARSKGAKILDRAIVRSDMPQDFDTGLPVPLSREEKEVLANWYVDGMLD